MRVLIPKAAKAAFKNGWLKMSPWPQRLESDRAGPGQAGEGVSCPAKLPSRYPGRARAGTQKGTQVQLAATAQSDLSALR